MGHLRRQKQGARSTKKSQQKSAEELMTMNDDNFEEIHCKSNFYLYNNRS